MSPVTDVPSVNVHVSVANTPVAKPSHRLARMRNLLTSVF